MTLQEELVTKVASYNKKLFPGANIYLLLTDDAFVLVITDNVFATYYTSQYLAVIDSSISIDFLLDELYRIWQNFIKEMEHESNSN